MTPLIVPLQLMPKNVQVIALQTRLDSVPPAGNPFPDEDVMVVRRTGHQVDANALKAVLVERALEASAHGLWLFNLTVADHSDCDEDTVNEECQPAAPSLGGAKAAACPRRDSQYIAEMTIRIRVRLLIYR